MKIPIQNLYYLLCFAWNRVPQELSFDVAAIPASSDVLNLCAYLLDTGTDLLLRRGLDQGYLFREEQTARLRGRININSTVKRSLHSTPQAICEFDELSPNVLHNQILRSSVRMLSRAEGVTDDLKATLRLTDKRLGGIDCIPLTNSTFGQVQLYRNNGYYAFLLFVCRLVHSLKLPDHGKGGSARFRDLLSDERIMEKVFEEFLRNFYRLKQREFSSVGSNTLRWNAEALDPLDLELLPVMKTDITLRGSQRVIIMDAKYYKNALQEHYGSVKAHSGNLYQLTTYLRTEANLNTTTRPKGILIYPVGENAIDASYVIDGYPVRLFTLNLAQDWQHIEHDLLALLSPHRVSAFDH